MSMETIRFAVEVVALVLAIPALVLARGHVRKLEGITRSLSTKYIDPYPAYVSEIAMLMEKAKQSVVVVCDVPAYCIFSDYKRWIDYNAAIQRAFANVNDKYVAWLDKSQRDDLLEEQFHYDPTNPDGWKQSPSVIANMPAFLARHNSQNQTTHTLASISFKDFEDLVERDHARAAGSFTGVPAVTLTGRLGLMFWIVDNNEAVFAVPNFKERSSGQGFRTTDQRLINAFLAIRDRLQ